MKDLKPNPEAIKLLKSKLEQDEFTKLISRLKIIGDQNLYKGINKYYYGVSIIKSNTMRDLLFISVIGLDTFMTFNSYQLEVPLFIKK